MNPCAAATAACGSISTTPAPESVDRDGTGAGAGRLLRLDLGGLAGGQGGATVDHQAEQGEQGDQEEDHERRDAAVVSAIGHDRWSGVRPFDGSPRQPTDR